MLLWWTPRLLAWPLLAAFVVGLHHGRDSNSASIHEHGVAGASGKIGQPWFGSVFLPARSPYCGVDKRLAIGRCLPPTWREFENASSGPCPVIARWTRLRRRSDGGHCSSSTTELRTSRKPSRDWELHSLRSDDFRVVVVPNPDKSEGTLWTQNIPWGFGSSMLMKVIAERDRESPLPPTIGSPPTQRTLPSRDWDHGEPYCVVYEVEKIMELE